MAKMLNENEVAAMLSLAPETLRAWRVRGKGPPFAKLGEAIRYDEEDVKAWVEARKVSPESKAATP